MKIILLIFLLFTLPVEAKEDLSKIDWQTNDSDPPFSAKEAKRGGTWYDHMSTYPLTFRLYGPNSNGSFAGWLRPNCFLGLVERHPNTLNFFPVLATHWAVMKDQKTVYYKLDPDVRFNDGHPVTSEDYVFAYHMMLSPHLKAPFYKKYYSEKFGSVETVGPYVVKIVGSYPSWKALSEYQVNPEPKHATKLDKDWVKRTNWKKPVCVGPYRVGKTKRGRYVRLERIKDWWGDKKRFLKNRFNFDKINIRVLRDRQIAFEHFKKGKLNSFQVGSAARWARKTDLDSIKKNWIVKKKVFVEVPDGLYGIIMNLNDPLLKDINLRKALQHLFDFDKINKKLMFSAYVRMTSIFTGTPYANKKLKPYPLSPDKAQGYLSKSGWRKRGKDGILINQDGQRLSLMLTYGSPTIERHLSVFKEDLKNEGIELKLKRLDPSTSFKYISQRNYQLALVGMGAGFYPDPEQYFHSSFAKTINNNNFFGHADPEVDKLIDVYNKSLDEKERKQAMAKLDEIINDKAFIIKFFSAPYIRVLYWNRYGTTPQIAQKLSSSINEYFTFYLDPGKDASLKKVMKENRPLKSTGPVDHDFFGVRKK